MGDDDIFTDEPSSDRPRPTEATPKMVRVATEAYMQAVNPYRNDDRARKDPPQDFRIQAAIEAVLKSEHLHWEEEDPPPPTILVEVTGKDLPGQLFTIASGSSVSTQMRGMVQRLGENPGQEVTTVPIVIRARLS